MISDSIVCKLLVPLLHNIAGFSVIPKLLQWLTWEDTQRFFDLNATFLRKLNRLSKSIHFCEQLPTCKWSLRCVVADPLLVSDRDSQIIECLLPFLLTLEEDCQIFVQVSPQAVPFVSLCPLATWNRFQSLPTRIEVTGCLFAFLQSNHLNCKRQRYVRDSLS